MAEALLKAGDMCTDVEGRFTLIDEQGVRIIGNTNGSCGYLYLIAYPTPPPPPPQPPISNKQCWDWFTSEQFQQAVEDEAYSVGMAYILSLPGVYEIVREDLNNAVLVRLANENGRCSACGNELNEDDDCEGCDETA
jgi:hypothetical protein